MSATVSVLDNYFSPAENVIIAAGGTVTWIWGGAGSHNVSGTFGASAIQNAGSFSATLSSPGTYNYQCDPHARTMRGVIDVR